MECGRICQGISASPASQQRQWTTAWADPTSDIIGSCCCHEGIREQTKRWQPAVLPPGNLGRRPAGAGHASRPRGVSMSRPRCHSGTSAAASGDAARRHQAIHAPSSVPVRIGTWIARGQDEADPEKPKRIPEQPIAIRRGAQRVLQRIRGVPASNQQASAMSRGSQGLLGSLGGYSVGFDGLAICGALGLGDGFSLGMSIMATMNTTIPVPVMSMP